MIHKDEHNYPFAAFITNLGKYTGGELTGEWVKFPTTPEQLKEVFERIGIGAADEFGDIYEKWFITDYNCYVDGLKNKLGEQEDLNELNYLANELDKLDESEYKIFEAAMDVGEYTGSVKEMINLTSNLNIYDFYANVPDYEALGILYEDQINAIQVPENIQDYFDYEAYGRDMDINEVGMLTKGGYVHNNGTKFMEYYNGDPANIPDECQVRPKKEESVKQLSETNNQESPEKTQNMRHRGKSR